MSNCVNIHDSGYIQLPGLSSSFSKGLTLQAWIYPDSFQKHCRIFDLGRGKEADNIILAEEEKSDDIAFAVYQGDKRADKLLLKNAFKLGAWTQITVTVDSAGNAKGYVNGTKVAERTMKAPKAAKGGVRTRCYVGKSNWGDDKHYDGRMAELRIWDKVLSAEEVTANYRVALVGDEPGLLGYWPLSGFNERGPVDLGRNQLHGSATKNVENSPAGSLPVARTPAAAGATRTIVTDYIPYTAFPSDRPLAGAETSADPGTQRAANVKAAGRCTLAAGQTPDEETLVTCPVWDVTLCGIENAPDVSLTFDRDVDLVTVTEAGIVLTPQKGGATLTWALAPDATVRVRIPAAPQLELPCATVRAGGGATRLDFPSIGGLVDVTSAELSKSKSEDAPPPLPKGTSNKTKDAVTLYIRQVACAAPVAKYQKASTSSKSAAPVQSAATTVQSAPTELAYSGSGASAGGTYTTSDFWKDPIGTIEDGFNDGADAVAKTAKDVANGVGTAVEDVGKALQDGLNYLEKETTIAVSGSTKLVLYTADAAKNLIEKAAKVTASTTASAIRSSIGNADKLCVSSVNAAANVVEIVGEIAGSAFRLVVQGIEEAISAIRAFLDRVGMVFRDFVEWLASLFSWQRFKANTKTIHDWVLTQLDNVGEAILAAGGRADDALAQAATVFSNQALNGRRFGDIVGKPKKMPGSAELDFVLSHLRNALDIGGSMRVPAFPIPALPDGPCEALASSIMTLPLDKFYDLKCGQVIAPLAAVWEELIDGLRAVLAAAAKCGADLVAWLKKTLTTRLRLPFFTSLFENILFPGWKLTPLRLIALTAAIPAQLLGWKLERLSKADLDAAGALASTKSPQPAGTKEASASVQTSSASATTSEKDDKKPKTNSQDDEDYLRGVAIAALVLESCATVVSGIENWYELKHKDTMKTNDLIVGTGGLAVCGGALALGVTICNICTATKVLKGQARDLAIACLTFELLNGVCTVSAGSALLTKEGDHEGAELVQERAGKIGMAFGATSFALGTAAAASAIGSAGATKEGDAAAGMWAMQAGMFLCDATGFVAERLIKDQTTRERTVIAMAVGSTLGAAGGVGWSISGVA